MESLESKLDRLSPDQRREAEDFVDFLLYRSGSLQDVPGPAAVNPLVLPSVPPAIPVMAPIIMPQIPPFVVHDQNIRREGPPSLGVSEEHLPRHEIEEEVEDPISRNYMDYGQFDQKQSPATEAVKKVKAKLIQKSEKDKPHHLLDWID